MTRLALLFAMTAGLCTAADEALAPELPSAAPLADRAITDDGARVAVLGYHDLADNEPETAMRLHTSKFRQQMGTLRQLGITVISLEDFLAWKRGAKSIPEKSVLLTFDDGWKSVFTDALPILKEFGYPFTLYLYKNYIDGGKKALTSDMIQQLLQQGGALGSHSVSHPYPAAIKSHRNKGEHDFDAFLRKEMGESKRFIESKFATSVTTYAYPGGFVTEDMWPIADEFGYTALFTVIPGKIRRATPDKRLPRYMILGNYDKVFELATSFRESQSAPPASGLSLGTLAETTPYPVTPAAAAIINTRLPLISANLTGLTDCDPKTLVMKVAGFGEVPAQFDPDTQIFSWQVSRRLRQPACQVAVSWLDANGKAPDAPLRWSFQIDREAAYLPEGE
ncbi:MAG: polysaccharide deacetylase family protein [Verrucomicrobia bacterium]|nr:MAG: polysaccharide deacetylase family protein [Verrucomicrobiota bacterium]